MQHKYLARLSKSLSLQPFAQDWGLANADPLRVDEFLNFYESFPPEEPAECEALAELLLQSMNEALEVSCLSAAQRGRAIAFIQAHSREFPQQLSYWSSLVPSAADPWPVLALLKEAGIAA